MKPNPCLRAARTSADPERARLGFELLQPHLDLDAVMPEQARILAALFSGSQPARVLLPKHPGWIAVLLTPESLAHPRQEDGLRREVALCLEARLRSRDYAGALTLLRQFKERELLRIAARDLARLAPAPEITREISNVADLTLDATLRVCRQQLTERLGTPWHQDVKGRWQPTEFCVLALGKLGGQELNFSSDVDVMFVYAGEGHVSRTPPGRKVNLDAAMSSHQFFKRLAEAFIAEIGRVTPEGRLHRIDLRLRPEGDAGPLVRSLESYENFYAQWGQNWERMMLIKARGVAGDRELAFEFLEMIQPFRYPRSLGESAVREIAAMKERLQNEVIRAGELDRNVKLGPGGIREIEFIVQTAQILHAGRAPFLQGAQTLPLLGKLVQYKHLTPAKGRTLANAYCFLRAVEHRVQMDNDLQTHTVPADRRSRDRLAVLMGFGQRTAFDAALKRHTHAVRAIYERFVKNGEGQAPAVLPHLSRETEGEWKKLLAAHSFQDVDRSFRLLQEFANGPGYVHISPRTTGLALQLIARVLALCRLEGRSGFQPDPDRQDAGPTPSAAGAMPVITDTRRLSDPDRVLARLDTFISTYGARAVLFETWNANPQLFELLLLLFDRSEFLAETAIRTPDLVDELVLSRRLGRSKNAAEILRDLRHGRDDAEQRLWIRRYHEAEFMRIGLRSILGLVEHEQHFAELTALADACLQYALEATLRRLRIGGSPLVIVGLGKLGGLELNYGSDLDILFVAGDAARRNLPRLQKVAVGVMHLLSTKTELGIAFLTDARLRPDGEKSLLVNTLAAYEDYYRKRAQLWEIQSLVRTRPVAGNMILGEKFQQLASLLTNFRQPSLPLAAYAPDWKQQTARMRLRIEKLRTPAGRDALAFKTGRGGLMDAEFIAQAVCLERGWHEPNTLRALERIRDEGALARADAEKLIANYRELRRLESILRRWSFLGEMVLPVEPAPYLRVSVRCGFATAEAFRDALARWRSAVREVYERVFPTGAIKSG